MNLLRIANSALKEKNKKDEEDEKDEEDKKKENNEKEKIIKKAET